MYQPRRRRPQQGGAYDLESIPIYSTLYTQEYTVDETLLNLDRQDILTHEYTKTQSTITGLQVEINLLSAISSTSLTDQLEARALANTKTQLYNELKGMFSTLSSQYTTSLASTALLQAEAARLSTLKGVSSPVLEQEIAQLEADIVPLNEAYLDQLQALAVSTMLSTQVAARISTTQGTMLTLSTTTIPEAESAYIQASTLLQTRIDASTAIGVALAISTPMLDSSISTYNGMAAVYAEQLKAYQSTQDELTVATKLHDMNVVTQNYNRAVLAEMSALSIYNSVSQLAQAMDEVYKAYLAGQDPSALVTQSTYGGVIAAPYWYQFGGGPAEDILKTYETLSTLVPVAFDRYQSTLRTRTLFETSYTSLSTVHLDQILNYFDSLIDNFTNQYLQQLSRFTTLSTSLLTAQTLLPARKDDLAAMIPAHSTIKGESLERTLSTLAGLKLNLASKNESAYNIESTIANLHAIVNRAESKLETDGARVDQITAQMQGLAGTISSLQDQIDIASAARRGLSTGSILGNSTLQGMLHKRNESLGLYLNDFKAMLPYLHSSMLTEVEHYRYMIQELSTQTVYDMSQKTRTMATAHLNRATDPVSFQDIPRISSLRLQLKSQQPGFSELLKNIGAEKLAKENYLRLREAYEIQSYYKYTTSIEPQQSTFQDYKSLEQEYSLAIQDCNRLIGYRETQHGTLSATLAALFENSVYYPQQMEAMSQPQTKTDTSTNKTYVIPPLVPLNMKFHYLEPFEPLFQTEFLPTTTVPQCDPASGAIPPANVQTRVADLVATTTQPAPPCGVLCNRIEIDGTALPGGIQLSQVLVIDSKGRDRAFGQSAYSLPNGVAGLEPLTRGGADSSPPFLPPALANRLLIPLSAMHDITAVILVRGSGATKTTVGLTVRLLASGAQVASKQVRADLPTQTLDFRAAGTAPSCPVSIVPLRVGPTGCGIQAGAVRISVPTAAPAPVRLSYVALVGPNGENYTGNFPTVTTLRPTTVELRALTAAEAVSVTPGSSLTIQTLSQDEEEITAVHIYAVSDQPIQQVGTLVELLTHDGRVATSRKLRTNMKKEIVDLRTGARPECAAQVRWPGMYGAAGIIARYITIRKPGSTPASSLTFSHIQIVDKTGANVAVFKPATASSQIAQARRGTQPASSRRPVASSYASDTTTQTQTYTIDLGEPRELCAVRIWTCVDAAAALTNCTLEFRQESPLATPILTRPFYNNAPAMHFFDVRRDPEESVAPIVPSAGPPPQGVAGTFAQSIRVESTEANPIVFITEITGKNILSKCVGQPTIQTIGGSVKTIYTLDRIYEIAAVGVKSNTYIELISCGGTKVHEMFAVAATNSNWPTLGAIADFRKDSTMSEVPLVPFTAPTGQASQGALANYVCIHPTAATPILQISQVIVVDSNGKNVAFECDVLERDGGSGSGGGNTTLAACVDGVYEYNQEDSEFLGIMYTKYKQRPVEDCTVTTPGNRLVLDLGAEREVNSVIIVAAQNSESSLIGIPVTLHRNNQGQLEQTGAHYTSKIMAGFGVDILDFRRDISQSIETQPIEVKQRAVPGASGCGIMAQYIRVEQSVRGKPLKLSQIIVTDAAGTNVALHKPTYATSNTNLSFRVVDGGYFKKTEAYGFTIYPTDLKRQYIEVNLDKEYDVNRVFVLNVSERNDDFNTLVLKAYSKDRDLVLTQTVAGSVEAVSIRDALRTGSGFQSIPEGVNVIGVRLRKRIGDAKVQQGLLPVEIYNSQTEGDVLLPDAPSSSTAASGSTCVDSIQALPPLPRGPAGGIRARYVRVYNVFEYIQISQFMVYNPNGDNIVYNGTATCNELPYPGTYASAAIDGVGGVFHWARPEPQGYISSRKRYDFWQVDLGSTAEVAAVRYVPLSTNRARNGGLRIQLLDEAGIFLDERVIEPAQLGSKNDFLFDLRPAVPAPAIPCDQLIMPKLREGPAGFSSPHGMQVDPTTGTLFVADMGRHCIYRVPYTATSNTYGTPVVVAGTQGTAGPLRFPIGLALVGSRLFIADYGNDRIQVLNTLTNAVSTWRTGISKPFAIAASADGASLFVSEYTATGRVVAMSTADATAALVVLGTFNFAAGLCAPNTSSLYVTVAQDFQVVHLDISTSPIPRQVGGKSASINPNLTTTTRPATTTTTTTRPATTTAPPTTTVAPTTTAPPPPADIIANPIKTILLGPGIQRGGGLTTITPSTVSLAYPMGITPFQPQTGGPTYLIITDSQADTVLAARLASGSPNRIEAVFRLAGTGTGGDTGDGSQGIFAQMNQPAAVVNHPIKGLLLVADKVNQRIRILDCTGSESGRAALTPVPTTTARGTFSDLVPTTTNPGDLPYTATDALPESCNTASRTVDLQQSALLNLIYRSTDPIQGFCMHTDGSIYILEKVGTSTQLFQINPATRARTAIPVTGLPVLSTVVNLAVHPSTGNLTFANGVAIFTIALTARTCTQVPIPAGIMPTFVGFNRDGILYCIDSAQKRIVRFIVSTFQNIAGGGTRTAADVFAATGRQTLGAADVALIDPRAFAFDSNGTLYMTDAGADTVYAVYSDGAIQVIVGSNTWQREYTLDGALQIPNFTPDFFWNGQTEPLSAPGRSRILFEPIGITVDTSNTIYISSGSNQILQVKPDGTARPYAGIGNQVGRVDTPKPYDSTALYGALASPTNIQALPDGTLLMLEGRFLREIQPARETTFVPPPEGILRYGQVTLMANGTSVSNTPFSVNPLALSAAGLVITSAVAHEDGRVFFTTGTEIRCIGTDGSMTLIITATAALSCLTLQNQSYLYAKLGTSGTQQQILRVGIRNVLGDTTPATQTISLPSEIQAISALLVHPLGTLYIATTSTVFALFVDMPTAMTNLLGSAESIPTPTSLAILDTTLYVGTANGTLYCVPVIIAPRRIGRVLGSSLTTLPLPASVDKLTAIAANPVENLLAITTDSMIAFINPQDPTRTFQRIAGQTTKGTLQSGLFPTAAAFTALRSIAFDVRGNLFGVDQKNSKASDHVIFQIPARTPMRPSYLYPLLGTGIDAASTDGALAHLTSTQVGAMAVGPDGTLYFTEGSNVKRVSPITNLVSTLFSGTSNYTDIWVSKTNEIYVTTVDTIRRIVNRAGTFQEDSIAGTQGIQGSSGDGGLATAARLQRPVCGRFDSKGNLYFVDQTRSAIRRIDTTGIITTFLTRLQNVFQFAIDSADVIIYAENTLGATPVATIRRQPISGDTPTVLVTIPNRSLFSIAVDSQNNLYGIDGDAGQLLSLSATGATPISGPMPPLNTDVGVSVGLYGDMGPVNMAVFWNPQTLIIDSNNRLIVRDGGRLRVNPLTQMCEPRARYIRIEPPAGVTKPVVLSFLDVFDKAGKTLLNGAMTQRTSPASRSATNLGEPPLILWSFGTNEYRSTLSLAALFEPARGYTFGQFRTLASESDSYYELDLGSPQPVAYVQVYSTSADTVGLQISLLDECRSVLGTQLIIDAVTQQPHGDRVPFVDASCLLFTPPAVRRPCGVRGVKQIVLRSDVSTSTISFAQLVALNTAGQNVLLGKSGTVAAGGAVNWLATDGWYGPSDTLITTTQYTFTLSTADEIVAVLVYKSSTLQLSSCVVELRDNANTILTAKRFSASSASATAYELFDFQANPVQTCIKTTDLIPSFPTKDPDVNGTAVGAGSLNDTMKVAPRIRYVRVAGTGLQLSQVAVLSAETGENLALAGTVKSSNASNNTAGRAINGNMTARTADVYEGGTDTWWEVDLGFEALVESVVIVPKLNTNPQYTVLGFNASRTYVPTATKDPYSQKAAAIRIQSSGRTPTETGGESYLHFNQLLAFTNAAPTTNSINTGLSVSALSATVGNAPINGLRDNNKDIYHSVGYTKNEFWEVGLANTADLSTVQIKQRDDCCMNANGTPAASRMEDTALSIFNSGREEIDRIYLRGSPFVTAAGNDFTESYTVRKEFDIVSFTSVRGTPRVRKVRYVNSGGTDAFIQICQLVAIDSNGVNVAYKKPTQVLSTYGPSFPKEAAVNGEYSSNAWNFYHSAGTGTGEFFEVDLGGNYEIVSVHYYNRDSARQRAAGSRIQLRDANDIVLTEKVLTGGVWREICDFRTVDGTVNSTIPLRNWRLDMTTTGAVRARYIRIVNKGPAFLTEDELTTVGGIQKVVATIKELKVFDVMGRNVAIGKPCRGSSAGTGNPSHPASPTSPADLRGPYTTAATPGAYWEIDLGREFSIVRVEYTNTAGAGAPSICMANTPMFFYNTYRQQVGVARIGAGETTTITSIQDVPNGLSWRSAQGLRVRFVRIEAAVSSTFSLKQVVVVDSRGLNVAVGRPTKGSAGSGSPFTAVNGLFNTSTYDPSIVPNGKAYWEVDLGREEDITCVNIYGTTTGVSLIQLSAGRNVLKTTQLVNKEMNIVNNTENRALWTPNETLAYGQKARFVRIATPPGATGEQLFQRFSQIAVINTFGQNVAVGIKPRVLSYGESYTADKVTNGELVANGQSMYASLGPTWYSYSGKNFIELDLGEEHRIVNVVVYSRGRVTSTNVSEENPNNSGSFPELARTPGQKVQLFDALKVKLAAEKTFTDESVKYNVSLLQTTVLNDTEACPAGSAVDPRSSVKCLNNCSGTYSVTYDNDLSVCYNPSGCSSAEISSQLGGKLNTEKYCITKCEKYNNGSNIVGRQVTQYVYWSNRYQYTYPPFIIADSSWSYNTDTFIYNNATNQCESTRNYAGNPAIIVIPEIRIKDNIPRITTDRPCSSTHELIFNPTSNQSRCHPKIPSAQNGEGYLWRESANPAQLRGLTATEVFDFTV